MTDLPKRKLSQDPIFPNLKAGDRVPVLRTPQDEPDAAKRNGTASLDVLAAAVADHLPGGLPGPNASKSLLKEFRYYRAVDRDADPDGGACFETDIDYASCCASTVAHIEFYRENDGEDFRQQDLECVYDSSPTPAGLAYVDGSFTGLRNPSKFVKVAAGAAGGYTDEQINTFLAAKLGVPIARNLSDIRQAIIDQEGQLDPGGRYDITGNWNATGTDSTVYVVALDLNTLNPQGLLRTADGATSVVSVDIRARTTTPVASYAQQQANTQQLALVAAKNANLYAHYADNSVAPFSTLDDFLAAAGQHGGTLRLEGEATALSITTTNRGGWPCFWDAAGSTIVVPAGVTLKSSAAGLANFNFGNFFLDGGGTFLLSGQQAQGTAAGQASRLFAGVSNITLDNPADVVLLDGGYYKKIKGAGKYYLLGSVQVDDLSEAPNVVDLRQSTGGGGGSYVLPATTATTLGGLKVGRGLQVDGAGVVSVGDPYTTLEFQPAPTLDMSLAAQLLTLTNNVGFAATTNRAQGRMVRVFLFNNTAAAVTLTFPTAWAFLGVRPTTLAAGKKGVLTLECVYGTAEGDIVAGYVDQN
jgi:hypothetical protein